MFLQEKTIPIDFDDLFRTTSSPRETTIGCDLSTVPAGMFHTLFGSFWDDYSQLLRTLQTDSAGRRFPADVEPLSSCCCFDVLWFV